MALDCISCINQSGQQNILLIGKFTRRQNGRYCWKTILPESHVPPYIVSNRPFRAPDTTLQLHANQLNLFKACHLSFLSGVYSNLYCVASLALLLICETFTGAWDIQKRLLTLADRKGDVSHSRVSCDFLAILICLSLFNFPLHEDLQVQLANFWSSLSLCRSE